MRRISLIVAYVGVTSACVFAQERARPRPIDSDELKSFADAYFEAEMARQQIPGAALVVVSDGAIRFAKGYGFADLERNKPVSPKQTVFRIASVSKLFTATAVMQLVERGAMALDDDVNKHLRRVHVPAKDGQVVTIAHLLTHRGGFPEQFIGVSARDSAHAQSLEEYLAQRMPPLVFRPGDFISYSNYGYSLLGQVIEDVSGQPFPQYMDEHILRPLGMLHSSFEQPLPPAIAAEMATGHSIRDGELEPLTWGVLHASPAGGLATTANDAARFMLAHLQGGQFEGVRILSEETARAMQRRQFAHYPAMNGLGYGFWEHVENGRRAISHDGGWQGFYSYLFLLPDENVGVFIAANALSNPPAGDFGNSFVRRFVERYVPREDRAATGDQDRMASPVPSPERFERAQRVAGGYRSLRIPPSHTFEFVLSSVLQTSVRANDDGTLSVAEPFGEESRWVEVEPYLYRNEDAQELMGFREDDAGDIRYLVPSGSVMEKLPWYDETVIQAPLLAAMIVVFAFVPLGWLVGIAIGKLRRKTVAADLPRGARLLANLVCILNVVFASGLLIAFAEYPQSVIYGVSAGLATLFVLPLISAALTAGCVAFAVSVWRKHGAGVRARKRYSFVTLLSAGFLALLNHWNLLGFRF